MDAPLLAQAPLWLVDPPHEVQVMTTKRRGERPRLSGALAEAPPVAAHRALGRALEGRRRLRSDLRPDHGGGPQARLLPDRAGGRRGLPRRTGIASQTTGSCRGSSTERPRRPRRPAPLAPPVPPAPDFGHERVRVRRAPRPHQLLPPGRHQRPGEDGGARRRAGAAALAITDHDSISGVIRFARGGEAPRRYLQAIVGAELTLDTPAGGAHHRPPGPGPHRLPQPLRPAHRGLPPGRARPARRPLRRPRRQGRGWSSSPAAPGASSPVPCAPGGRSARARWPGATATPSAPERYFVEVSNHRLQADGPRNAGLRAVAQEVGVGLLATNNAHYHDQSRALLHHVVTCIRHRTTLEVRTAGRGNRAGRGSRGPSCGATTSTP